MPKNENYEKHFFFGLLISLLLISAVGFIWLGEPTRMEEQVEVLHSASVAHGKALYQENCATCHGSEGEGLVAPPLNSKTLLEEASNEVLYASIDAGRPGTTMPAWGQEHGGALTQEDMEALADFIRTWEENAPVISDEFVPSPVRGATIFASTCFLCHGEAGLGNTAPAINNHQQLNSHDDDWYRQTITVGRPAQGMPGWGNVISENQTEDLIALFGAWRGGQTVLPEFSVAELLDSALFSVSQKDGEDTIFYLKRAKEVTISPAAEMIDEIIVEVENESLEQALVSLNELSDLWPLGVAENGEPLFAATCAPCHGPNGEGGLGSQLNPNEFVQENTNSALLEFMLAGREGTLMQGFEGRLTESQIADLLAFLREWQP